MHCFVFLSQPSIPRYSCSNVFILILIWFSLSGVSFQVVYSSSRMLDINRLHRGLKLIRPFCYLRSVCLHFNCGLFNPWSPWSKNGGHEVQLNVIVTSWWYFPDTSYNFHSPTSCYLQGRFISDRFSFLHFTFDSRSSLASLTPYIKLHYLAHGLHPRILRGESFSHHSTYTIYLISLLVNIKI